MTDEEKIKLASQIAINFGIDCTDAKCRVEQAFMNFGKELDMSTETSDKNVVSEEDVKKNIEFWENEVKEALKEDDIMKAIGCRVLANKLREDIGEKKI